MSENEGETEQAAEEPMEPRTSTVPEVLADESELIEVSELDTLRETNGKLKEQLLRTAADFDNFRKRARRDVEDATKRSREQTLLEILPLVDNLERAVQASETAEDVAAVVDGVRMVLRSFNDIADRLGLERVDAVGERFDPNLHDAVQQVETDEHPAGSIVAEVMSGYRVGDKLLRAAMVVVARPPSED